MLIRCVVGVYVISSPAINPGIMIEPRPCPCAPLCDGAFALERCLPDPLDLPAGFVSVGDIDASSGGASGLLEVDCSSEADEAAEVVEGSSCRVLV